MRTKAKGPAFSLISNEGYIINAGLSKREYFAAMALTGIISANLPWNEIVDDCEIAVNMADGLIKQLNIDLK